MSFIVRFLLTASCLVVFSAAANAEELYTVQLTARDGRFYPETLNVPAGQRVKIVFRNDGPGIEEFDSRDLRQEKVVMPGATLAFVLMPLKPGVYRFIGELHPDTAKGQVVAK
ncbi:MAG: cupredoxin domain-containing protein [Pseudomonadota bacterium]